MGDTFCLIFIKVYTVYVTCIIDRAIGLLHKHNIDFVLERGWGE